MRLKLFIAALMFGLAMPAAADFTTIEQAYEVALSEMRLPRSEGGTIAFKECSTCDYRTKRVDANARWLINGKSVSLKEFRLALSRVTDRNNKAVTVLHHLENNRVTEVSVYL
jgi:hypothetical protein